MSIYNQTNIPASVGRGTPFDLNSRRWLPKGPKLGADVAIGAQGQRDHTMLWRRSLAQHWRRRHSRVAGATRNAGSSQARTDKPTSVPSGALVNSRWWLLLWNP